MKNLTVKRFLLICIVFAMGVLSIVGVAADVVRITPAGAMPAWMCYVGNGFDILQFDSGVLWREDIIDDGGLLISTGVFVILQLIMALVTVIIAVTMLFRKNEKKNRRLGVAFMIVCLSLQFIYMALSIIASALYGIHEDDLVVTTLAYIPFIFGLLLFIAFLVLCKNKRIPEGKYLFSKGVHEQSPEAEGIGYAQDYYNGAYQFVPPQEQYAAGQPVQQPYYGAPVQPQQAAGQPAQQLHYGAPVPPQQPAPQPAPQPSAADSMEEKVKLLTQYKQLLDSGILTQEEFDKLKAETLGKQ